MNKIVFNQHCKKRHKDHRNPSTSFIRFISIKDFNGSGLLHHLSRLPPETADVRRQCTNPLMATAGQQKGRTNFPPVTWQTTFPAKYYPTPKSKQENQLGFFASAAPPGIRSCFGIKAEHDAQTLLRVD
ncbi:MAG: hypothetical protein U5J83_08750 [Bryobacterales bacterium]|nr:hypothetical protein [Bryobacterales bacterium]